MLTVKRLHCEENVICPAQRPANPAIAVSPVGRRHASSASRNDLVIGRKAAGLFFRVFKNAIDGDVEHATDTRYQFNLGTVFLLQQGPRTEGARLIVSGLAPIDPDFHGKASA
jgi:hypothetical protein